MTGDHVQPAPPPAAISVPSTDTPVAQCGDYNRTNVLYRERFYVGYRWYDAKGIRPLFPFGYGRSYTTFSYGDFRYDAARRQASVKVTNTGRVAGKATVRVYGAAKATQVERPVKELKGFAKTRLLAPGESETLMVALDVRAFAYWDVLTHRWRTDPGGYEILFAASAADVLASLPVKVE